MTHRKDAASDVLDRWRTLAEQRLEHLTELFESGRWRRYHSELAFLENIQEAKVAVETWRALSTPNAIAHKPRAAPAQPIRLRRIEPAPATAPKPVAVPVVAEAEFAAGKQVPAIDLLALERALEAPASVLDVAAIEQRYPLLRNAL